MRFGQRERNDHMVMNQIVQQGWSGAGSAMLWAMGVDGGCREGDAMPSHSAPPAGVQTHTSAHGAHGGTGAPEPHCSQIIALLQRKKQFLPLRATVMEDSSSCPLCGGCHGLSQHCVRSFPSWKKIKAEFAKKERKKVREEKNVQLKPR